MNSSPRSTLRQAQRLDHRGLVRSASNRKERTATRSAWIFPGQKGNLKFDGETFQDVGVRYKGNYTFMATSQSLKKSIKLDLNRFVKGQKLDGLTMLNLHCGVSDRSRTRETLSFAFFREAGVPAPRTSFAELTLTVTGKYETELVGIYALVEQVNKEFLKRHFEDGNGMLLKPEELHGGPAYLGSNWTRYQDQYRPESTLTDEQKKRLIDFTEIVGSRNQAPSKKLQPNAIDHHTCGQRVILVGNPLSQFKPPAMRLPPFCDI